MRESSVRQRRQLNLGTLWGLAGAYARAQYAVSDAGKADTLS